MVTLFSLAVCFEVYFLQLWNMDFHVPLYYMGNDELLSFTFLKIVKDNGWIWISKHIGAPFGTSMFDFPMILQENIAFLIHKILTMITGDIVVAFNIQNLLAFPMIAIVSYLVMKWLKINDVISICGSLVFALSPYVFLRMCGHFFLAYCYFVPLSILLCFWLLENENFFVVNINFFKNRYNLWAIVFCFLIANNGNSYYAPITVIFIIITGVAAALKNKNSKTLLKSAYLSFIICLFVFINLVPHLVYDIRNGANAMVAQRSACEAEIYGLKIVQLYMPNKISTYFPKWNALADYLHNAPLQTENVISYLGLMGIIGFTFLIIYICFRLNIKNPTYDISKKKSHYKKNSYDLENQINQEDQLSKRLTLMAQLNIFAVLFSTIGGFASIFALLITPQLRAWNRIFVFIAYISILSFCLLMNKYASENKNKKYLTFAIIVIISFISIIEQFPNTIPNYQLYKDTYQSDHKFVKEIENIVPQNAMIFQLPYHAFPESGPVNNMGDYGLLSGYTHSKNLRWSYGGIKGRKSDLWNQRISALEISKMVDSICFAGFQGVYIDRRAYTEEEIKNLESQLKSIIRADPMVSDNNILSFFNLEAYKNQLKSRYSDEEWENEQNKILNIVDGGI